MTSNALDDRMKRYEKVSDNTLTPNSCAFVRIDGRAFHTFTKNRYFKENMTEGNPFSRVLRDRMIDAALATAQDMQGFKLAYHQSDEVTFMMTDFDTINTDGWFGYRVNKLVSMTASMFTAHFNRRFIGTGVNLAFFDARAFVIPFDDAPNMFVWRQRDWNRNSVAMLAQAHFSHKELLHRSVADMHEMLHSKGINWANLSPWEKNGTFIDRNMTLRSDPLGYDQIKELITPEVETHE